MKDVNLKTLVQQAQAGNRRAFSGLIDRCKNAVYGVCLSLVGEFDLAEDMAQEAFIQAYLRLDSLKDPDRFAGWLRTIAMNRCRNYLRHKKPATVSVDTLGDVAAGEESPGDQADMSETTLLALGQLSEANRQALTLFYLGDYSVREIGKFLGVSEGAVKVRLYRARRQLREETLKMVADTVNRSAPGSEFEARVNTMIDAIEAGDRAQVERLLQEDPNLVEARRKDGQTVLLWAAHAADHGLVDPDVSAPLLQATRAPDLFTAANFGLQDRVRRLVEDRPERVVERDGWTRTALHWAAHGGQPEVAAFLLDQGADENTADPRGWTPLHLAVEMGQVDVVKVLLDWGADVRALLADIDMTPLHVAVVQVIKALFVARESGDMDRVQRLLKPAQDPVVALLVDGGVEVDLFVASAFGWTDRVAELLTSEPDGVHTRVAGTTPLYWAAPFDHREVVTLLVDGGNEVDIFMASLLGWTDRVAKLLEADPEHARARMLGGESPLLLVSFRDEPELVQLLLDCGADVHQTGPKGATALKRAMGCGCDRVAALLKSNGAMG